MIHKDEYPLYMVEYRKGKHSWFVSYQTALEYAEFVCKDYAYSTGNFVNIYGVVDEVRDIFDLIGQLDCETKQLNNDVTILAN